MKIKKIIFVIFLFLIGLIRVNAENEYIKLTTVNDTDGEKVTYIYSPTETEGTVNGLSYDSSTNTLIFNSYDLGRTVTYLEINNMGNLNINVSGENKLVSDMFKDSTIHVENTNITIDGTGELKIYGTGITSTGNININNIKITGYGIVPYSNSSLTSVLINCISDVNIYNTTFRFASFDSNASGVIRGKNVTIDNSDFYGMVKRFLYDTTNATITNSNIKLMYGSIVSDNLTVDNSTISINTQGTGDMMDVFNYTDSTYYPYTLNETEMNAIKSGFGDEKIGAGLYGYTSLTFRNSNITLNKSDYCLPVSSAFVSENTILDISCIEYGEISGTLSFTLPNGKDLYIDNELGAFFDLPGAGQFPLKLSDKKFIDAAMARFDEIDNEIQRLEAEGGHQTEIDELNAETAQLQNEVFSKMYSYKKIQVLDAQANNNESNQIINNVPKTGVITFIGLLFGISILIYGTYLLIKSTKKAI